MMLQLEQSKSSMNLKALHGVENRTAHLEKHVTNNQQQLNQLSTKIKTINKTIIKLTKNISDIEEKSYLEEKQIQQQLQQLHQSFVDLLTENNLKLDGNFLNRQGVAKNLRSLSM